MSTPGPILRRDYAPEDLIAGKYRLVSPIATGGMGTVWIAHNIDLDVRVALKLIRTDVAAPIASGRLLQEARAAARLGHPGIVRVFDFGQANDQDPFIVMELLAGESLAHTLERRTRLNVHRALQTLLPIADALSVAHSKGIVHRDLKPENIFLHRTDTASVQPKIVDFGIARLGREENKRLTQDGMVMGSPAYMSPEQARGQEDVDHRADVWSFAVVLYETITGKLPFDAPNNFALLRAVVEKDPKSVEELGVGDAELWKIIELALRKDREERWQSMRALGGALAEWLVAQGVKNDVCGGSLKAAWLTTPEEERARSSVPPPSIPSGLEFPPLNPRELVTIETTSVTLSPPSKKRNLWRAGLMVGVGLLAASGFWFTREYLVRAAGPPAAAAQAVSGKAVLVKPVNPQRAASTTAATQAAQAEPGKAPPLPVTSAKGAAVNRVKGVGRRSASRERPRSAASELKLPY
ncbi:MAG TPA: serine/threonine-protein kinase [Polyangiaceae bacterium]|nr:serine/threonine-protein kinase [Polyangiaceae bacterium]